MLYLYSQCILPFLSFSFQVILSSLAFSLSKSRLSLSFSSCPPFRPYFRLFDQSPTKYTIICIYIYIWIYLYDLLKYTYIKYCINARACLYPRLQLDNVALVSCSLFSARLLLLLTHFNPNKRNGAGLLVCAWKTFRPTAPAQPFRNLLISPGNLRWQRWRLTRLNNNIFARVCVVVVVARMLSMLTIRNSCWCSYRCVRIYGAGTSTKEAYAQFGWYHQSKTKDHPMTSCILNIYIYKLCIPYKSINCGVFY